MTVNFLITHRCLYKYSKSSKNCFEFPEASKTILKVAELSKYDCKPSINPQRLLQVF